ncbi:hypothetical protein [Pseudomonas sp. TTU2014-080ASC]|uniref:hypothetical protein n=1 Tax=Pseudomonas sp. TTU2014-080ASC TaxID=1729724 RepID=UPI000AC42FE3|nr:hypothetical protein [Pseudomonas sp. TTU2014-080ASC]
MKANKLLTTILMVSSPIIWAADADSLSQQLANPVSDLISVPFQANFDFDAGPDDDGLALPSMFNR